MLGQRVGSDGVGGWEGNNTGGVQLDDLREAGHALCSMGGMSLSVCFAVARYVQGLPAVGMRGK